MKTKQIHFILNPSEITAGTRGASLGPGAVLAAGRNKGSLLFGQHKTTTLKDVNHLIDQPTIHQFAKRIDGLGFVFDELFAAFNSVEKESFPFVISGDHGSAAGTIAAIKKLHPNKKLGVVWIDAHADLHSPFTTPSGNMHGMPLAIAIAENNTPCQSNDVPLETAVLWEELKSKAGNEACIRTENLVFVAVRDTEEQEDKLMERFHIKNHTVDDVTLKGEKEIASQILKQLEACDHIYISFDVDSMDPQATSHGTGTPVDKGLMPAQAQNIMQELLKSGKVCCLEVVEVNPCLDENINKMADVTFEIIENLVETITK